MLVFSLARRICLLKNQVNFWNRMIFLNKRSDTVERFQGTIEVALWRKFLTAGHLEASTTEQYYNLEEFVHQKSKIIFGIA